MRKSVAARALSKEKTLHVDLSLGGEKLPIPVFNGADEDASGMDFTYVTECVVSEGMRMLLGGPMRDTWQCPYAEEASKGEGEDDKPIVMAYDTGGLFLHPPHTIDSVYECTLASGCGLECRNRVVQRGPKYRLEVIRCMEKENKFVKGWGVRSPDFIPKGSFICEYIGEYISDDEAESRGIRYDNAKMSRLMDVVGDGRDVVRMCIDATRFSNLGRFLNHSCASAFPKSPRSPRVAPVRLLPRLAFSCAAAPPAPRVHQVRPQCLQAARLLRPLVATAAHRLLRTSGHPRPRGARVRLRLCGRARQDDALLVRRVELQEAPLLTACILGGAGSLHGGGK